MDHLLIHSSSEAQLRAHISRPPQSLLLWGPEGMGKRTVALAWANMVSSEQPQIVEPEKTGIGIEAIRQLYRAARSRSHNHQIIIIDHAETMSPEAENAFLKLLEEPRPGITFVLTAPHQQALLPTTLSRVQAVFLQPLPSTIIQTFIQQKAGLLPATSQAQILFAAQGRPAVAMQLINNPEQLQHLRAIMQQAKDLLTSMPYQRLTLLTALSKDREHCQAVLEALLQMASLQLAKASATSAPQWLDTINRTNTVLRRLQQNGNTKAQLLELFI